MSGGPLEGQSQPFFPTIEVAEIIPYRHAKPYEDMSFLTDLYLRKGWSLRRISEELQCSKGTVRKKLLEAGVELVRQDFNDHLALRKKIKLMRERNLSYQTIAESFNIWKVPTRTKEGVWHPKTVRDLDDEIEN